MKKIKYSKYLSIVLIYSLTSYIASSNFRQPMSPGQPIQQNQRPLLSSVTPLQPANAPAKQPQRSPAVLQAPTQPVPIQQPQPQALPAQGKISISTPSKAPQTTQEDFVKVQELI